MTATALYDTNQVVKVRRGIVSCCRNKTISCALAPEILACITEANPEVQIRVREDSSPQAIENVLSGQSELALAQFGEGHPDLEFEAPIDDRFVIVCHNSHPLSQVAADHLGRMERRTFFPAAQ